MESIMILNGENRGVLGTVRSLGKRGIPIFVGGSKILSRANYSKYCKRRFIYHTPDSDIQKMHEDILRNVKQLKPDVLLPFSSDTAYVVLKNINEYKGYCNISPLLNFKKFNLMNDKETMIKEVLKFGCIVPKTYFLNNIKEAQEISERIEYPVLIKPRVSAGGRGIIKVSSPEELVKEYAFISNKKRIDFWYDPLRPIIQEFIQGETIYTVYVLFNKGKHVASMVKKVCRQYPSSFGPVIAYDTILNEKIRSIAVNLFKQLNWNGPANINFIIDPKDNKPKMLEINPRLWATVEMSIKSGIDFPYMLYKLALGEKIEETTDYIINQRFRWVLFGEFFYLLKSNNKLEVIKDYLNLKNIKTEIDLTDIKPHLIHFLDLCINKQVL